MDRLRLKMDAKAAMSQANPHPVLVTLIYFVIIFALQFIVSMMSGIFTLITQAFSGVFVDGIIAFGLIVPSTLLFLVSSAVIAFLQLGYTGYTLRVINRHPAGISDLFGYARFFLKSWGLSIVMEIFISLWSLLFVIPGIVAYYRYSMAFYILAEDPGKGIMECINESKTMMIGYKMDKFILDLSFIGWYLLTSITCGIAAVYVTPYTSLATAGFYNSLKYGYNGFNGNGYGQGGYQQGYNGYQNGYQNNYNQSYDNDSRNF